MRKEVSTDCGVDSVEAVDGGVVAGGSAGTVVPRGLILASWGLV